MPGQKFSQNSTRTNIHIVSVWLGRFSFSYFIYLYLFIIFCQTFVCCCNLFLLLAICLMLSIVRGFLQFKLLVAEQQCIIFGLVDFVLVDFVVQQKKKVNKRNFWGFFFFNFFLHLFRAKYCQTSVLNYFVCLL